MVQWAYFKNWQDLKDLFLGGDKSQFLAVFLRTECQPILTPRGIGTPTSTDFPLSSDVGLVAMVNQNCTPGISLTRTHEHGPGPGPLIQNGSRLVKTLRLRTAVCCVEGSLQLFLKMMLVMFFSPLPVFGENKWMLFVCGQSFIHWRDLGFDKVGGVFSKHLFPRSPNSKHQLPSQTIPNSHLRQAPVVTHP